MHGHETNFMKCWASAGFSTQPEQKQAARIARASRTQGAFKSEQFTWTLMSPTRIWHAQGFSTHGSPGHSKHCFIQTATIWHAALHTATLCHTVPWKWALNAEPSPCFVQEAMRQLPKERSCASFLGILVMFVRKECPTEAVFTTNVRLAVTSVCAESARRRPRRAITSWSRVLSPSPVALVRSRFAAPDCNPMT